MARHRTGGISLVPGVAAGGITGSPWSATDGLPIVLQTGFETGDYSESHVDAKADHQVWNHSGLVEEPDGTGHGNIHEPGTGDHGVETADHHGVGTGHVHTGTYSQHAYFDPNDPDMGPSSKAGWAWGTSNPPSDQLRAVDVHTYIISWWVYIPSTYPTSLSNVMLFQSKLIGDVTQQPNQVRFIPDSTPTYEIALVHIDTSTVNRTGVAHPTDEWINHSLKVVMADDDTGSLELHSFDDNETEIVTSSITNISTLQPGTTGHRNSVLFYQIGAVQDIEAEGWIDDVVIYDAR